MIQSYVNELASAVSSAVRDEEYMSAVIAADQLRDLTQTLQSGVRHTPGELTLTSLALA
ncbi:MAG: hypothetical protein M3P11_10775 [Actinomycetota bacterium]|nr:hypothetical protein [Actinomycetota bacterium]